MTSENDLIEPLVVSVGEVIPEPLRPSALGAGFVGAPSSLYLVFGEEFREQEAATIRSGNYIAGFKLVSGQGMAGLVWQLVGAGLHMGGYANYSLAHVCDRLGPEVAAKYRAAAEGLSFAGSPGYGLLVPLVFVEPDTAVVFAMRAFTLPRLFSDRFLRAIIATESQDLAGTEARLGELLACGEELWSMAGSGVAVAGRDLELSDGEWSRLLRDERARRARKR